MPKITVWHDSFKVIFEMFSMFIANIYVIFDQWYNKLLKKYNFNLLASAKKELSKNTVWKIMKRHGVTFQLPFFKFTITQSTFIAAQNVFLHWFSISKPFWEV